jgi:hypothetical protein
MIGEGWEMWLFGVWMGSEKESFVSCSINAGVLYDAP